MGTLNLEAPGDIARARNLASKAMDSIDASVLKKTRFVTAVSEIARNTLIHGGGGTAQFFIDSAGGATVVMGTFRDSGPGIEDVERALTDGYSTGNGLGLGLGGAKRLVDFFELDTAPGSGVFVRIGSRAR